MSPVLCRYCKRPSCDCPSHWKTHGRPKKKSGAAVAETLSAEQIAARKAKFAEKKARRAAKLEQAQLLNAAAEQSVSGGLLIDELKRQDDSRDGGESPPSKRAKKGTDTEDQIEKTEQKTEKKKEKKRKKDKKKSKKRKKDQSGAKR